MPKDGPKQKALAKAEANMSAQAEKDAQDAEQEAQADWSVGAKGKGKKAAASEGAEAERVRQAVLKREAREADDADVAGLVVKKGATKKKKGKDDFDLLNAALKTAPKSKAQREAEDKKKKEEETKAANKKKNEEIRLAKLAASEKESANLDKLASKGMVMNHTDDLFLHSKHHNKLDTEDEVGVTGIEGAIDVLDVSGKEDKHPEKRMKALYNAYLEKELVEMRSDHPGLKLSQYKERIFESWKKSAENPKNQAGAPQNVFGV